MAKKNVVITVEKKISFKISEIMEVLSGAASGAYEYCEEDAPLEEFIKQTKKKLSLHINSLVCCAEKCENLENPAEKQLMVWFKEHWEKQWIKDFLKEEYKVVDAEYHEQEYKSKFNINKYEDI